MLPYKQWFISVLIKDIIAIVVLTHSFYTKFLPKAVEGRTLSTIPLEISFSANLVATDICSILAYSAIIWENVSIICAYTRNSLTCSNIAFPGSSYTQGKCFH